MVGIVVATGELVPTTGDSVGTAVGTFVGCAVGALVGGKLGGAVGALVGGRPLLTSSAAESVSAQIANNIRRSWSLCPSPGAAGTRIF